MPGLKSGVSGLIRGLVMIGRFGFGALAAMLLAAALQAQESRGTILGSVTDASGAVVPAADVKAVNTSTGVVASAQTNESGNFTLPYLVAGFYNVSAETAGFKKIIRENVQV